MVNMLVFLDIIQINDAVYYCCTESTGHYLLIALLLSTFTLLSQTAFQLYGIFAEPGTLTSCKILLLFAAAVLLII